ncbi:uncharacterized protein DSM5745_08672 [Aspergillus mulundensis]|uniref:Uncharacterized protein n=1 Tax=Aspergillus mulundensis TaxID=1810919 RepID=A0A3D8R4C2_9EURO|nr:hypothetical protein DSM5745_08672 [Aspergillus mulundensis]RDW68912.1 hypothetical protein DSM5745_08672 [Aspergillus mulundensis]
MALRSNFKNVKIDEEDEFVCQCGFRMKDFPVKKNPSAYYGLHFHACAKHSADPTRCKSTIWSDEKERVRSLIPPAMRSPRTPRKQVDIRVFGQYTAPSTLKRKAETESFDSAGSDMTVNEPVSPCISRPVKRVSFAYVDVATQTGDTSAASSTASTRPAPRPVARPTPTARPMPRRRLFEEYLVAPKSKPTAKFDPFAPRSQEHNRGDQDLSVPTTPPGRRPRQSLSPPETPATVPKIRKVNAVPFPAGGCLAPQAKGSSTPPSMRNSKTGLFTPPTARRCQTSHPHPSTEHDQPEPGTPTKSNYSSVSASRPQPDATPPNTDSDNETYGWDDDLNQNILQIMETVENRRHGPLFV